ncbi:hypothetical protein Dacet_1543 [Denitrovibrio acetiphilus DSM 12809]|uniref:FixH family protein n=1 Tax=Denitrovibrio acetiphilus (strain DSM 12809 / NBRC 114555 / N2460) TaxID=522772 RepID=D4H8G3_DENA2|nr:FixH family protein [Denitrovibrio acetiphilus]ADD68312.1 hypothetical protein Dacet_1543 [Denitrovibrio acetiphilus DSM 12809]
MRVSIIIFLIGFITIAPSIYVGIKYFDGKVTDQPYETGLKYDSDKQFIKENGLDLSIISQSRTDNIVNLNFTVKNAGEVALENIEFYLSRPATNKETLKLDAEPSTDGSYASAFSLDQHGYYILMAKSKVNDRVIRLQKSFYIN